MLNPILDDSGKVMTGRLLVLWRRYRALLDKDLNKEVFENLKNLLVCAFLFAAGTSALHDEASLFMGLFVSSVAGWGLIVISGLLLFMNICDGLRKLALLRYHLILQVLLCVLYIVVAVRIVELVWGFRTQ
jgi:hypothetical protein